MLEVPTATARQRRSLSRSATLVPVALAGELVRQIRVRAPHLLIPFAAHGWDWDAPIRSAGPSRNGRDQRARLRAVRPSATRRVPSTRWVGAAATVSDGSPAAVAARRATHANDHQRGLQIHRHGTLPSDPQIVQPVTPSRRAVARSAGCPRPARRRRPRRRPDQPDDREPGLGAGARHDRRGAPPADARLPTAPPAPPAPWRP